MESLPRNSVCRTFLALVFVLFFGQIALAETLYERSLPLFQQRQAQAKPEDFTFVVLGDSRGDAIVFSKALCLAQTYDPLFVLHGGDYSERGSDLETDRFLSLVRDTVPQLPLFVVKGNHENPQVFSRKVGPETFVIESRRLGLDVIVLDNSANALNAASLDFLKQGLSRAGRLRFVAMHVPPRTQRWNWHTFKEGAEELRRIVAGGRVQGIFFSHVHLFDRAEFGGVPAIVTGGAGAPLVLGGFPGEAVYHITVVRVKGGKAAIAMVPLTR